MGIMSDQPEWMDDYRAQFTRSELVAMDDAFEDGVEARLTGEPLLNNPYKRGTVQRDRWNLGWLKEDRSLRSGV